MKIAHAVVLSVAVALVGAACSEQSTEKAKDTAADVAKDTKAAGQEAASKAADVGDKIADKTKDIAGKTAEKTGEIAGKVASKTKEVGEATAEAVTDGWITTKIKAKFADEKVLDGSHISVDTNNYVVTLKGTVTSAAGKAKAESIAVGTKGVTRVVNQIVVK